MSKTYNIKIKSERVKWSAGVKTFVWLVALCMTKIIHYLYWRIDICS